MKLTKVVACTGCKGTGRIEIINTKALRQARERKGITLREMARRLGFSAPYISDIELGRRHCPPTVAMDYQELL